MEKKMKKRERNSMSIRSSSEFTNLFTTRLIVGWTKVCTLFKKISHQNMQDSFMLNVRERQTYCLALTNNWFAQILVSILTQSQALTWRLDEVLSRQVHKHHCICRLPMEIPSIGTWRVTSQQRHMKFKKYTYRSIQYCWFTSLFWHGFSWLGLMSGIFLVAA